MFKLLVNDFILEPRGGTSKRQKEWGMMFRLTRVLINKKYLKILKKLIFFKLLASNTPHPKSL